MTATRHLDAQRHVIVYRSSLLVFASTFLFLSKAAPASFVHHSNSAIVPDEHPDHERQGHSPATPGTVVVVNVFCPPAVRPMIIADREGEQRRGPAAILLAIISPLQSLERRTMNDDFGSRFSFIGHFFIARKTCVSLPLGRCQALRALVSGLLHKPTADSVEKPAARDRYADALGEPHRQLC